MKFWSNLTRLFIAACLGILAWVLAFTGRDYLGTYGMFSLIGSLALLAMALLWLWRSLEDL